MQFLRSGDLQNNYGARSSYVISFTFSSDNFADSKTNINALSGPTALAYGLGPI